MPAESNQPETRVREIFTAAFEQPSAAARRSYLDQACANDPQLRARVESLLRAFDQAGEFLASDVHGQNLAGVRTCWEPTSAPTG